MGMEGTSEIELIEGARQGDPKAQEGLVRLYEGRIFGHVYRMVGNKEDARDILQKTMVRALTNLHQYNPANSFAGWIFRIATNRALDFLRRRKLEMRTFAYEGDIRMENIANGAVRHDAKVAENLDWDIVEGCLERLDPRYRTVLFLRYRDGLSYKEISDALSIPMGTVKVLLHRGRLELKKLVRKEVGTP